MERAGGVERRRRAFFNNPLAAMTMKLRAADVHRYSIPLRMPFHAAGVEVGVRSGLLLRLHTTDGRVGVGEAATHPLAPPAALREAFDVLTSVLPTWTGERRTLEELTAALRSGAVLQSGAAQRSEAAQRPDTAPQSGRSLPPQAKASSFEPQEPSRLVSLSPVARAALEMACYDLTAQERAVRVAEILGAVRRERVPVNAVIDHPQPSQAAAAARRLAEQGFRCMKVKIAAHDIDAEVERLNLIRSAVGEAVSLRVDANAMWTVAEAIAATARLARCGLEYIEQPVAEVDGLAAVRRARHVPIAADESVTGVEAVETIAAAGAADVIIVKPSLLGLMTAAAVVRAAQAHNLSVVITSALETSIGLAAALHLAAALPEPIRPCGLATAALLAGDLVRAPLLPRDGHLHLPVAPGLGVRLDEAACQRWFEPGGARVGEPR